MNPPGLSRADSQPRWGQPPTCQRLTGVNGTVAESREGDPCLSFCFLPGTTQKHFVFHPLFTWPLLRLCALMNANGGFGSGHLHGAQNSPRLLEGMRKALAPNRLPHNGGPSHSPADLTAHTAPARVEKKTNSNVRRVGKGGCHDEDERVGVRTAGNPWPSGEESPTAPSDCWHLGTRAHCGWMA